MTDRNTSDHAMHARYARALTLEQFVARATANRELWATFAKRSGTPPDLVDRANRLPARRHLLVLLEDWCGDAVNTIPALAALAEASSTLDLRILARDENPDLMDAHLTAGTRSIPVVIILDEECRELGWWGPRPTPLQTWVRSEGQVLDKTARYREVRRWYARDRAATTLAEILELLESARRSGGLASLPDAASWATEIRWHVLRSVKHAVPGRRLRHSQRPLLDS